MSCDKVSYLVRIHEILSALPGRFIDAKGRRKYSDLKYSFFLSGRRRHTRCGRDWSSDVCSSDLEVYVRWSDVDFAGIIFYGSYVRLFEIAETELFRHCGLAYARMFDEYDIFLPRKAVHSEFYWPARLDDRLRIGAYVGNVGTKSLTLHFVVLRTDASALGAAGWM